MLAEIAVREKILDEAEFILDSAVAFEPQHIGARFDLANVFLKRQKFDSAHQLAEQLIAEQADNTQFLGLSAASLIGIGETDKAADILRGLIDAEVNLEHAYLLLGHAEKTLGNLPVAIESYQKLYDFKPDFGDAFWSLANTKTYEFTEQEIAHMEDYKERDETSDLDKVCLLYTSPSPRDQRGSRMPSSA